MVLTTDPALEAAARYLLERVPVSAAGVDAEAAHIDSSVFDGRDAVLARGGWALMLKDRCGRTSGSTPGRAWAPNRSAGRRRLRRWDAGRHRC